MNPAIQNRTVSAHALTHQAAFTLHSIFFVTVVMTSLILSGCTKGLDNKPDFSSMEGYKTKVNKDLADVSESKREAFNFALSDVSSLDDLSKRNQGKTYLQMAEAELDSKASNAAQELTKVQAQGKAILEDLKKIEVTVSNIRIEKDFFGNQFKFDIQVNNASTRDVAAMNWLAHLYLEESDKPAAHSSEFMSFESIGGLKAGSGATGTIQIGHLAPVPDWVSLASLNAKSRKVVLELVDATDFSNQSYINGFVQRAEYLQAIPRNIEKARQVLRAKDEPATAKVAQASNHQTNRTSCTNQCTNGSCVRTFPDGTTEQWQAPRKFDPLTQNWEWDINTNACGQ